MITNNIKKDKFLVVSGPCVIEGEDIAFKIAEKLVSICSKLSLPIVFKGSYRKANRTRLDSFTGIGDTKALKILGAIGSKFEIPVTTDIHSSVEAKIAAEYVDIIQIPAFLARQTDLVSAAAKTSSIIQFKKPQFLSAQEMSNVVEKCEAAGNKNITLCERGNSYGYNNLVVDTLNFQILKKLSKPVIFDVTHSLQLPGGLGSSTGGRREYVLSLAKAGMSQSIAGLFLEAHPNPDEAKCDGPCALPLSYLDEFLNQIKDLDDFVKGQNNLEIK